VGELIKSKSKIPQLDVTHKKTRKTARKEKEAEVNAPQKKKQWKATEMDTPSTQHATRLQAGGSQDATGNRRSTRKKCE
jgi:hypothetical protein